MYLIEKTIIGVTPLWDEEKNSYWMLPGYPEGVKEAGAIPVVLPLTAGGADIARLMDLCDGFLFTGGQDVAPQLYGETMKLTCGELCPARDTLERELLHLALERDKSILGICRGIQLLNACLGGTLYQDLPTEHPSETVHTMTPPYDRTAHTVHIWPMTPLASLLEKTELEVNSCHHQAVKTLAPGLAEMARSTDDLIEAVYLPGKTFVWAVQWHPELSFRTDENSRKIFQAFIGNVEEADKGCTIIGAFLENTQSHCGATAPGISQIIVK